MHRVLRLCLTTFLLCLPVCASAANEYSVHAEWTAYTAPDGYTVSGYNLYKEGTLACQVEDADATSMDCLVTLEDDVTNFSLTATFSDGSESPHSTSFAYTTPSSTDDESDATAPTASISTSVAAGTAPLKVVFNGSDSAATSSGATIESYAWDFGDESTGTGEETSHTYTEAGTYTATLTVTDSNGQTATANTPIVITASSSDSGDNDSSSDDSSNQSPTAVIALSPKNGTAPLTVSFDASSSTDADGSIAKYAWDFGNDETAVGKTASYTYTTAGTYTVTLEVTDNSGATNSTTSTVTVTAANQSGDLAIEAGEVTLTGAWKRVALNSTFTNPIVVAGPATINGEDPCTIRVRNVNSKGFDIKIAEWDYLEGKHNEETVRYLVLEKGHTTLANGTVIEAGTFTGTSGFRTVGFSKSFKSAPIVLTTVASVNCTHAVSSHVKRIKSTCFLYSFKEQEKNGSHPKETVNYIAWQPGTGTIGNLKYEAGKTGNKVTESWYSGKFQSSLSEPPLFLADMQTTNGGDPATLRLRNLSKSGYQVQVDEEQSKDQEVRHEAESVGYLIFSSTE